MGGCVHVPTPAEGAPILIEEVRSLRAELHEVAERSGHERETAATVRRFLSSHGIDAETGIGGHGIMVRIGDGPARLLRADLDALPDGARGARHACGHDGHAAMLAGGLVELANNPPEHAIVGLFQPSEENGRGMRQCLKDRRFRQVELTDAYAIHNIPGAPMGQVIIGPGALASTGIRITLRGRAAHAASPHEGHSPHQALHDLAGAVTSLSEGLDDPRALATLIHVRLGREDYGTSPGEGVVAATLRGSNASVSAMKRRWVQSIPDGFTHDVTEVDPFPETANTDAGRAHVQAAATSAGLDVMTTDEPFPWSEDFGHAVGQVGGALIGLGSGQDTPALHDDDYEFPDDLLGAGTRLWTALGREP